MLHVILKGRQISYRDCQMSHIEIRRMVVNILEAPHVTLWGCQISRIEI